MTRTLAQLPGRLFLVAMFAGAAVITATSLGYFDFETLPPFVVEKLPVRFEALWLASLRVHVAAALLTLPLCLLLTTRPLRRRLVLHRWTGRVTGVLVLFALVPSGVVLAFDAKGGRIVTAGFLLSAAIVAWFMVRGVAAARRGDVASHNRAMRHVVAQMSVAVTSRALLLGFDAAGVNPDLAYVIALWGPVLVSAAVVELASPRTVSCVRPVVQFVERIRRGSLSSLACRYACAFPLCLAALAALPPSLASADEPSLAEKVQHRVEEGLLKPLAAVETHRFSRSRPPPRERRVRVEQATPTLDKNGRAFVPFAVDVRFGGAEWHEDDIVGCAYTASGKLFVKRGDEYRAASFLLGKNEEPVAGVCEAGPARS